MPLTRRAQVAAALLTLGLALEAQTTVADERENRLVVIDEFFRPGLFWSGSHRKLSLISVGRARQSYEIHPTIPLAGDAAILDVQGGGPPVVLICGRDPARDAGVLQIALWDADDTGYRIEGTYREQGSDFVGMGWSPASGFLYVLDAGKQRIVRAPYVPGNPLPESFGVAVRKSEHPPLASAFELSLHVNEASYLRRYGSPLDPRTEDVLLIHPFWSRTARRVVTTIEIRPPDAPVVPIEQRISVLLEQLYDPKRSYEAADQLWRLGSPAAREVDRLYLRSLQDLNDEEKRWEGDVPFMFTLRNLLASMAPDARDLAGEHVIPLAGDMWQFLLFSDLAPYTSNRDVVEEGIRKHVRAAEAMIPFTFGWNDYEKKTEARTRARLSVDLQATTADLFAILRGNGPAARREMAAEVLGRRTSERETILPELVEILRELAGPTMTTHPAHAVVNWSTAQERDLVRALVDGIIFLGADDPLSTLAWSIRLCHRRGSSVTSSSFFETQQARRYAARRIASFGPAGAGATRFLRLALGTEEIAVVCDVILALGEIGPAARQAVPALTPLSEHGDPLIRSRARIALRNIGEGR